jgi:pyruvate formate-lyase activating enzyme-like uncharacterized protein
MRGVVGNPETGLYIGKLPRGCELCRLGSKLVVFISGKCGDSCYYCPVSAQRFESERMFANEAEVEDLLGFIYEAYKMKALGAGITGGDPLLAIDRTVKVIELLKQEFGPNFHIHLYTSGKYATEDSLRELERAGLDEIRFHPIDLSYLKFVERAMKFHFDVGVEVPVIPGQKSFLRELIRRAEKLGVKFVNLNELEISERNANYLLSRGFKVSHGMAGVDGSSELAKEIVGEFAQSKPTIHYCTALYKDVVETRTRFLRMIRFSSKPYEEMSAEGTVIRALVKLKQDVNLDEYGERVEEGVFAIWPKALKEILNKYGTKVNEVYLIEEHPDSRRLLISKEKIL